MICDLKSNSETATLLMICVEEVTKESNSSYEFAQRQNVVLDYGMNFVINTGIWLVSLKSKLLKHTGNDEICDRKCDTRRPSSRTSAIIE